MAHRLIDIVQSHDRRMVIPLMGFPGVQLNGSSLKLNTFNWGTQFSTLQALDERFHPDAMFFFMDLSVEASALGLLVRFPLDESPSVELHPVRTVADLDHYRDIDILTDGRVFAYLETMRLMARQMDTLKGAYVIGPFTLAGLLMGATETAMATIMDPDTLHAVLRFSCEIISRYIAALEDAGADMICILEPTASLLSPTHFADFSAKYVQELVEGINVVPILHICGQATRLIPDMVETGAQGLSLGHMVDFPAAAQTIPEDVVLIGNLDPVRVFRQMGPEKVQAEAQRLLEDMAPYPNFILSSGCDLLTETPLENIDAMICAVHE